MVELMGSLSLDGKDDTFVFLNPEGNVAYLSIIMAVGKTKLQQNLCRSIEASVPLSTVEITDIFIVY